MARRNCEGFFRGPSAFPREQQLIPDREQRGIDALVGEHALAQRPHDRRRPVARIDDLAAHEGVVDRHHTAAPEQREALLVVSRLSLLVGIEEGEVEAASYLS